MNLNTGRQLLKKAAIPMMVIGGGLAAFGLTSYQGSRLLSGWSVGGQITIAIGVALFILGALLRKESE